MNKPLPLRQPKPPAWQTELSNAFSNAQDLYSYLNLSQDQLLFSKQANLKFAMRVPLSYAKCMEKSNPDDPLLRQILPIGDETIDFPGYLNDPVGDLEAAKSGGIIHKYHARALIITTGSCAINCRYCFRRNFPYSDFQMSKSNQTEAVHYIENNPDISEVILSGGDPFLLNDGRFAELFDKLGHIGHVKRIRIHSRIPIVLPSRITNQLIKTLTRTPKEVILVIHCNHANEISPRVISALSILRKNQVHLLNQAVLLKGINDNADQLCLLSEKLFSSGVIPYYLHMLDKAVGTGHFEVDENIALELMHEVKARLPGYLVPKLVREDPGENSKTAIFA